MKKIKFYICPECGNILTAMGEAGISCCGRSLQPLVLQKAAQSQQLKVERMESDFYITSDHPMTKEHFIAFIAFLTGDSLILRKLYPEWDLETRIPMQKHGRLIWYCKQEGAFYQDI